MKGKCRECGRVFRIRADGTVRYHTDQRQPSNLPFKPRCAGADKPPRDDPAQASEEAP